MAPFCHDVTVASVRIGDGTDFLQFDVPERGPDVDPGDDEFPIQIQASLQLSALSAGTAVWRNYWNGFGDLVAYFDGLERDWRGWSGVRRWQSLDRELTIDARHDGHIQWRSK